MGSGLPDDTQTFDELKTAHAEALTSAISMIGDNFPGINNGFVMLEGIPVKLDASPTVKTTFKAGVTGPRDFEICFAYTQDEIKNYNNSVLLDIATEGGVEYKLEVSINPDPEDHHLRYRLVKVTRDQMRVDNHEKPEALTEYVTSLNNCVLRPPTPNPLPKTVVAALKLMKVKAVAQCFAYDDDKRMMDGRTPQKFDITGASVYEQIDPANALGPVAAPTHPVEATYWERLVHRKIKSEVSNFYTIVHYEDRVVIEFNKKLNDAQLEAAVKHLRQDDYINHIGQTDAFKAQNIAAAAVLVTAAAGGSGAGVAGGIGAGVGLAIGGALFGGATLFSGVKKVFGMDGYRPIPIHLDLSRCTSISKADTLANLQTEHNEITEVKLGGTKITDIGFVKSFQQLSKFEAPPECKDFKALNQSSLTSVKALAGQIDDIKLGRDGVYGLPVEVIPTDKSANQSDTIKLSPGYEKGSDPLKFTNIQVAFDAAKKYIKEREASQNSNNTKIFFDLSKCPATPLQLIDFAILINKHKASVIFNDPKNTIQYDKTLRQNLQAENFSNIFTWDAQKKSFETIIKTTSSNQSAVPDYLIVKFADVKLATNQTTSKELSKAMLTVLENTKKEVQTHNNARLTTILDFTGTDLTQTDIQKLLLGAEFQDADRKRLTIVDKDGHEVPRTDVVNPQISVLKRQITKQINL